MPLYAGQREFHRRPTVECCASAVQIHSISRLKCCSLCVECDEVQLAAQSHEAACGGLPCVVSLHDSHCRTGTNICRKLGVDLKLRMLICATPCTRIQSRPSLRSRWLRGVGLAMGSSLAGALRFGVCLEPSTATAAADPQPAPVLWDFARVTEVWSSFPSAPTMGASKICGPQM